MLAGMPNDKSAEFIQQAYEALGSADDTLSRLALLRELRVRIDAEVAGYVADARHAGESWAAIGTVLGITRQSAQERFGR